MKSQKNILAECCEMWLEITGNIISQEKAAEILCKVFTKLRNKNRKKLQ